VEKEVIRGWDVKRGKTWVKFSDGHEGIIADWHGGVIRLEGEPATEQYRHRDDVVEWRTQE
jgi:hypothetical protein